MSLMFMQSPNKLRGAGSAVELDNDADVDARGYRSDCRIRCDGCLQGPAQSPKYEKDYDI